MIVVVAAARDGKPLARPRIAVWIRQRASRRSFAARAIGKGHFRARVVFPAPGRWTLGARTGTTSRVLRTVNVTRVFRVREPFRAVLARDGSLLVADGVANRILRVDPGTGSTSSFAGNGSATAPSPTDDARAASIGRPIEVAVAPDGDVAFVSDEKVWRIDAETFALTHVAGTTNGHGGDGGPAARAQLSGPTALAFDAAGNLFVAEYGGYVRRIDGQTGVIGTMAGIGVEGSSGDGGPATAAAIDRPHGIAVADGTVYVSDSYGGRLRRFTPGGTIASAAAGLSGPTGIAVAGAAVYVAELFDGEVSRIDPAGTVVRIASVGRPTGVAVLPDGVLVASLIGLPGAAIGRLVRIDPATGRVTELTR